MKNPNRSIRIKYLTIIKFWQVKIDRILSAKREI